MQKLAILNPVYNGLDYTKKSLANLEDAVGQSQWKLNEDVFIIIIDDGSTDGTAEWIRKNHPEVTICAGDGNLWWSGAINLGAEFALNRLNCSYILLWNNDIHAECNYFANLYELVNSPDAPLLFGSKIYIEANKTVWFMGGIFNPKTGKIKMIGYGEPDNETYNRTTECDWLTGMGTIVHKSIIEKIGFWNDKDFPQYHGDSDFTYRAKKAGFIPYVYPQLKITNDINNSGLPHNLTWKRLRASLTSIKSYFNIKKDILFYSTHSTRFYAYMPIVKKYLLYFGGFIKHKYLSGFLNNSQIR